MPRTYEELLGEYDWELTAFQRDDPEQRTIIGKLADDTVIKGKSRDGQLQRGLTYRFCGYWVNHHKYGRQFHFDSFSLAQPNGERGTVLYLARARGIGVSRARRIWDLWGDDSLTIVREQPERVAREIPGISLAVAEEAAAKFNGEKDLERTTIELTDLIGSRGFPKATINQAIERWGSTAADVIRENPYRLMAFRGIGFAKADKFYLSLGKDPANLERQAHCVHYSLTSDTEGHVWFPLSHAAAFLGQSVAGADARLEEAVSLAVGKSLIATTKFRGTTYLASYRLAGHEAMAADALHRAEIDSAGASAWPPLASEGPTPHQTTELAKARAGTIGVLAGSPGTGKTYVLAHTIKSINSSRIAVCAPTGKAAVRVTEALAREGVNLTARTIHSTLRVMPNEEGGWDFEYDADNPMPYDWVFVDESSMIDTPLMANLLSAVAPGARVLFVGDPDQLSPVGPGAPLRDMIAAGIPSGHLTEIKRTKNTSRIVLACAEIRDAGRFSPCRKLDLESGENLLHIERGGPEAQWTQVRRCLMFASEDGRNPVWDVQILAAVNEKSPLARKALNAKLQWLLNATGHQEKGNPFRVGDKIINGKNGWFPAIGQCPGKWKDGKVWVANGEMARVKTEGATYTVAETIAPQRTIKILKGRTDDGDGDTGSQWELGYAISTHKSQGSEWPVVIVLLDSYPGAVYLCDKHWLYTAISRAKEICITIGKKAVADGMVRKSHMWKRRTFLRESLAALRNVELSRQWEKDLCFVQSGVG